MVDVHAVALNPDSSVLMRILPSKVILHLMLALLEL